MGTKQRPPLQGTPEQQSPSCVQSWPYSAQIGPASAGGGWPPGGPPSEPLIVGGAHLPPDAPGSIAHVVPAQQSAVVVQAPLVGTHDEPPQTKGGEPAGFGTHGTLQQSTLEAHGVPAAGTPPVVQS
jgi:hypothetical protein